VASLAYTVQIASSVPVVGANNSLDGFRHQILRNDEAAKSLISMVLKTNPLLRTVRLVYGQAGFSMVKANC
jgi:hypothetical protein